MADDRIDLVDVVHRGRSRNLFGRAIGCAGKAVPISLNKVLRQFRCRAKLIVSSVVAKPPDFIFKVLAGELVINDTIDCELDFRRRVLYCGGFVTIVFIKMWRKRSPAIWLDGIAGRFGLHSGVLRVSRIVSNGVIRKRMHSHVIRWDGFVGRVGLLYLAINKMRVVTSWFIKSMRKRSFVVASDGIVGRFGLIFVLLRRLQIVTNLRWRNITGGVGVVVARRKFPEVVRVGLMHLRDRGEARSVVRDSIVDAVLVDRDRFGRGRQDLKGAVSFRQQFVAAGKGI